MSLSLLHSRAAAGIDAPPVAVEVHLGPGLPGFAIVGLPEKAVQESKDRVRGALVNAGFDVPQRKVTVNLAPADLPKEGGRFDLPIALGILAASGQIDGTRLGAHEFVGELALSGALRPIRGALPVALAARAADRALVLPRANAPEAVLVRGLDVLPAEHLLDVCAHLNGAPVIGGLAAPLPAAANARYPDLADVRGQAHAKRALEVAAAGGHSLLMIGPPGTGKSMLAARLPGLLPPLGEAEALETAAVVSLAEGAIDARRFRERPFRAPHHTASGVALVGGGGVPRPGEISLAHHGVLFLDELPEFDRRVLEALREPLETGRATAPACPARCWIASTSRSRCRRCRRPCWRVRGKPEARRAPWSAIVSRQRSHASRRGRACPTHCSPARPSRGTASRTVTHARCSARPSIGCACPRAPTTACCGWPGRSPTSQGRSRLPPPTSRRRSAIAGWTGCADALSRRRGTAASCRAR